MVFSKDLDKSMEEFLRSLQEECKIYQEVYIKAKEEREAIIAMDVTGLKKIIHEKQQLLDRAKIFEERIADLRNVWDEAREFIRESLSEEISGFLRAFSHIMQELVAYENQNEKIFIEKNRLKEEELMQLNRAQQANKAYVDSHHYTRQSRTDILG